MRHIGVLEAKTDFSALVAEVERTGRDVMVTRYGRAAVRISPARPAVPIDTIAMRAVIDRLNARRRDAEHVASGAGQLDDLLDRDRDDQWL